MRENSVMQAKTTSIPRARRQSADDDGWRTRQARRPMWLALSVVALAAFLTGTATLIGAVRRPTQSDLDARAAAQPRGPVRWEPSRSVDPASLAALDLERVHAELLPAWVVSLQYAPHSRGQEREQEAFGALVAALQADANLTDLLRELRERALDDVRTNDGHMAELLRGWNRYMHDHELPFHVAFHFEATARGGRLFTRSYRVIDRPAVRVGSHEERVRLLRRVDRTNLAEMFFGSSGAGDDGACVIADRITDYAVDRLWMMFDPEAEPMLSTTDRAFAEWIRREAEHALAPGTGRELRETAELRRAIFESLAILSARTGCGRTVEIQHLAWNGISPRGQAMLLGAAAHNQLRGCTLLTEADAQTLLDTSQRLSSSSELEGALGRLAAWLGRAVSTHEARHLADFRASSNLARAPECVQCPKDLGARDRAELSAYVASFATPGTGYLSLYQACGVDLNAPHASAAALRVVLGELLPRGCQGGPPEDLYAAAASLERGWFRRVEPLRVSDTFPPALPLPLPQPLATPDPLRYPSDLSHESPPHRSQLGSFL